MVHHDIAGEIPADKRWLVRRVFFSYVALCIILIYQCVAVFFNMVTGGNVAAFFLAVIYLAFGVPGAWILWYMRLYIGEIRDSVLSFGTFFIMYVIHIGFCVFSLIGTSVGLPIVGGGGTAVTGFTSASEVGESWVEAMYYIGAACWAVLAAYSVYCLLAVLNDFRGRNGPARL